MDTVRLGFIGGCHIAGYLVENSTSFVEHLDHYFSPCEIQKRPYIKIEKLPKLIRPITTVWADVVFLQLGNFEFSASWKQILETTVGIPALLRPDISRRQQSAGSLSSASAGNCAVSTSSVSDSRTQQQAGLEDSVSERLNGMKVALGSLLYVVTWFLWPRYRQPLDALNQLIARSPQSTFVCMTPFPCLSRTHNVLRKVGGWIMKNRLTAQPNLQWVDTHELLGGKAGLFTDGVHLNAEGHKVLADHLWEVCRMRHEVVPALRTGF